MLDARPACIRPAEQKCELICGPAVDVLATMEPRSADMVYVDPPFFTQQNWIGPAGSFSDMWSWDGQAEARMDALLRRRNKLAAEVLTAIAAPASAQLAYLLAMEEIIRACRRILTSAGTFWLHCDDHASAHLRLVADAIFGLQRFWGIVTWWRSSGATRPSKSFVRCHDTILVYVRTGAALAKLGRASRQLASAVPVEIDGIRGHRIDGWAKHRLGVTDKERVGYPTQKPASLLRFIIEAGSRPGDMVVDPCCGSGSTLIAARQSGRRAIGIDQSADAVRTSAERLRQLRDHQLDLFGLQHA